MSNIQNLTASLDLKQNLNIYATCKQFDDLNLILLVYDNSVQADLTNYNVRMKAMKADKIPLIQEHTGITINNNIVTITADEQLTTTTGKTLIELQFINSTTGEKKATFNLALVVSASTFEVDRKISIATYTLLHELENKLDQATDYFTNVEAFQQAHPDLLNLENQVAANTASLSDYTKINSYLVDTGVANAYIITPNPAIISYITGQVFRFKAVNANTGASTISANGLTTKSLVKNVNIALITGDILAGQIITAIFDGINFQMVPDYSVQLANKVNKTDKKSEMFFATRDASIVGTQTITGLSGIPKRIEVRAMPNDALTISNSLGSWESGNNSQSNQMIYKTSGGLILSNLDNTKAIMYLPNESNASFGKIQNVLNGQFDIVWTMTGTVPTKTLTLQIIVYYN